MRTHVFQTAISPLVMPGLAGFAKASPASPAMTQGNSDSWIARRALPLPSHRAAPIPQRRPHAARQPELVDRGRATERLEAVQLDAAPLEAAFLQNVARGRVGHPRAGKQMLAGK